LLLGVCPRLVMHESHVGTALDEVMYRQLVLRHSAKHVVGVLVGVVGLLRRAHIDHPLGRVFCSRSSK
jgi:hypothetical protein